MPDDCGMSDRFVSRRYVHRPSALGSALYSTGLVARDCGRLVLVHRLLRDNAHKHRPNPGRA
jgi:hypothetical protein